MNNNRSPKECVEVVTRSINDWINKGICQRCALLAVASLLNIDHKKVEAIWIDHNVNLLDEETALD